MALKHSIQHTFNLVKQSAEMIEKAKKTTNQLLEETNATPEELEKILNDPTGFSEEEWAVLQKFNADLDHKVDQVIATAHNPDELKKKMSERASCKPHWLFVR